MLAVVVPEYAIYDNRLAQFTLPAVEALMAVTNRETFLGDLNCPKGQK